MQRYDIAIIGSGPAGISAAITAKVRNKNILLLGDTSLSIKISKAQEILNYPG
ncbi:MAG: FAD-dependent oxidoreductase, partial [Agathobacter sp.]|nr:FAD-dependent oxidoreductase [Agathobacter sp.]